MLGLFRRICRAAVANQRSGTAQCLQISYLTRIISQILSGIRTTSSSS